MGKPLLYTIACIAVCFLFPGCGKLGKEEPKYTYTVTNTTPKKIQFDIYQSQEDYNNGVQVFQQFSVEPGEAHEMDLTPLKEYYFDWYSDDLIIGNWKNASTSGLSYGPGVKYSPAKQSENITISWASSYFDTSRSIILNGGHGSGSRWLAAQQYNTMTNALIGPAPYIEIILKKDFTAQINELAGNGDTVKYYYNYYQFFSTSIYKVMTLSIRERISSVLIAGLNYTSNPSLIPHSTRDTLRSNYYNNTSERLFSFVRQ